MIHLSGINKSYKTSGYEIKTALKEVSIHIKQYEFIALLGPADSGKSTLLHVLGFLESPDTGFYTFAGKRIGIPYSKKQFKQPGRRIGFMFSNPYLIEEMTIFENTAIPLRHLNLTSSQKQRLVYWALDVTGILHRSKQHPYQITFFQQQLAALSRAIVAGPLLLLADEPMKKISKSDGHWLAKLFTQLNENNLTIILSTGDPAWLTFTHRTLNMSNGKIISANNSFMISSSQIRSR